VGNETASGLDLLPRTIIVDVFVQTHAVSLAIACLLVFSPGTPVNEVLHTKTTSSAKYQVQLRTIPRGQSQMVGSWEVVIATLHTDLVHNLLVPLMSYVSIKPSSSLLIDHTEEP
jgi:hypothetical protein